MIRLCKEEGLSEPRFELRSGGLAVTFKFKETVDKSARKVKYKGQIEKGTVLTPRQYEILTLLDSGVEISATKIVQQLSYPLAARTLRDDLSALKKFGLIDSRGRGSHAIWFKWNKETKFPTA